MPANQQLKEYIDQQVKVGVSKDMIKRALLEAGWQESDINEAMAGLASPVGARAAKPIEITKPVEIKPIETKPIEVKKSDASPVLSTFSSGLGPQEKTAPVSFVTSDIFQKKYEPVFEPKGIAPQTSFTAGKPQIFSAAGRTESNFFKKLIVPIVLGALALLFIAVAGIFYMQNNSLQTKLDSVNKENESLNAKLNSLAGDKSNLADRIVSLNQTLNDVENQLSIFAMTAGTSTTEIQIDVRGMLGGGGKSPYSVTTNKAIVVYVKNSKDAKVDAMLKPLIGNQIEISGTHVAGSNVATVTSINGQLLESFVLPTSTSTTSTSTPKTATSTTP